MLILLLTVFCSSSGICITSQLSGLVKLYSITSRPVTSLELHRTADSSFSINSCSHVRSLESLSQSFTKFIIITTQKSGSTWFVRRLGTHRNVFTTDNEPIEWITKLSLRNNGNFCSWCEIQQKIVETYQRLANFKASDKNGEKGTEALALGFKVMYSQVRHVLPEFVHFCAMNSIRVVHFYRGASVASYWTYNAQFLDRLQTGDKNAIRTSKHVTVSPSLLTNEISLDIVDSIGAENFVKNLENLKSLFRRRFMYASNEVFYFELAYEKMIGKFADKYWKLLFSFLDVSVDEITNDTLSRVHTSKCNEKFSDWPNLRKRLKNTDSFFACDMGN